MKATALALLFCLCCCALIDCQRRRIERLPRLTFATEFNQYSGYLTSTNGRRLFYWLVESSEVPPADAPLVLWLNGGPGCSSVGGLLMTNGPFLANDRAELEPNELAWNRLANMLYIDSPNGVGLSEPGPVDKFVLNDDYTTELNLAALAHFFALFPEYRGRPFYIAGESYGGIYIPLLAHAIQKSQFYPQIMNLKGIAVGNGLYGHYKDAESHESLDPYFKEVGVSFGEFNVSKMIPELNLYNIAQPCHHPLSPNTYNCLNSTGLVSYLNYPQVRRALGVNETVSPAYRICSDVFNTYSFIDRYVLPELTALANGNVSVMLYHGTLDGLIATGLTQSLLQRLPQNDHDSTDSAWLYCFEQPGVSGMSSSLQIGGLQKSYLRGRIRYRTVIGAGHSVVTDRPDMGFQILADFLQPEILGAPKCKNGGMSSHEMSNLHRAIGIVSMCIFLQNWLLLVG